MIVWSNPILRSGIMGQLRKGFAPSDLHNVLKYRDVNRVQIRTCKGHSGHFNIVPSSFSWNKAKDIIKFYVILTSLPFVGIVLYANLFIGPATLKPIPEGYEPKYWEYHQHPVTRFICKYITENPQKNYEKLCHFWFYMAERNILRDIEQKVKFLIADRHDFQAWYYNPGFTKYMKNRLKVIQDVEEKDLQRSKFPLY